jgi:septal ring factor EnvC (AmiA/AmiB activator)
MADEQSGLRIPQWLLGTLAASLVTSLIALAKLIAWQSEVNALQDQRLNGIEQTQQVARGVIEREDERDRELHAELAKLRERVARLERAP